MEYAAPVGTAGGWVGFVTVELGGRDCNVCIGIPFKPLVLLVVGPVEGGYGVTTAEVVWVVLPEATIAMAACFTASKLDSKSDCCVDSLVLPGAELLAVLFDAGAVAWASGCCDCGTCCCCWCWTC